jgi:biotin carboxyl carrier protein
VEAAKSLQLGPDWFKARVDAGEDPFAEMARLRRAGTPPTVSIWGLTLVAERPVADDGVELFVRHAAASGAAEFEVADPLNDLRNLEVAAGAVRRSRHRLVGILCHATSPVHPPDLWPALGVRLRQLGCAGIVIQGADVDGRDGENLRKEVAGSAGIPVVIREVPDVSAPKGVRAEVKRVREELGFPPLAGPIGRLVVDQAQLNLDRPRRYEKLSPGIYDYLQGLYGKPPGAVSRELRLALLGVDEPVTMRPGQLLRSTLARVGGGRRKEARLDAGRLLVHMLFPQMAGGDFRPDRDEKARTPEATPDPPAAPPPPPAAAEYDVEVEGEVFRVRVTGVGVVPALAPASTAPAPATSATPTLPSNQSVVVSPMQGLIVKIPVAAGDSVRLGDVVAVLEAMKMQNDIVTTVAGKVAQVYVAEGQVVSPNQPLVGIA